MLTLRGHILAADARPVDEVIVGTDAEDRARGAGVEASANGQVCRRHSTCRSAQCAREGEGAGNIDQMSPWVWSCARPDVGASRVRQRYGDRIGRDGTAAPIQTGPGTERRCNPRPRPPFFIRR